MAASQKGDGGGGAERIAVDEDRGSMIEDREVKSVDG
jgi:hypothetical protein